MVILLMKDIHGLNELVHLLNEHKKYREANIINKIVLHQYSLKSRDSIPKHIINGGSLFERQI